MLLKTGVAGKHKGSGTLLNPRVGEKFLNSGVK
jgi:hypothetical protein